MILTNPGFDLSEEQFVAYVSSQKNLESQISSVTKLIGKNSKSRDWGLRFAIMDNGRIQKEIDDIKVISDTLKEQLALPTSTPQTVLLVVTECNRLAIRDIQVIMNGIKVREEIYYNTKINNHRKQIKSFVFGGVMALLIIFVIVKLA